jgi:hypothetical protein
MIYMVMLGEVEMTDGYGPVKDANNTYLVILITESSDRNIHNLVDEDDSFKLVDLIKEEPALLKIFNIKQVAYPKQLASGKRVLTADQMIIDDAETAFNIERGVIGKTARVLLHLKKMNDDLTEDAWFSQTLDY